MTIDRKLLFDRWPLDQIVIILPFTVQELPIGYAASQASETGAGGDAMTIVRLVVTTHV
jgi:hypothetical protein